LPVILQPFNRSNPLSCETAIFTGDERLGNAWVYPPAVIKPKHALNIEKRKVRIYETMVEHAYGGVSNFG
jgi:hypothetical protein